MSNPMDISASALNVARFKMDIIAKNIANSESIDYKRKEVTIGQKKERFNDVLNEVNGVEVKKVIEKEPQTILKFDPDNPLADEKGLVKIRLSDPIDDVLDMIEVSRYYEANLAAIEAFKNMNQNALNIGR
jgi:flagellar basal-body rod protein FlgC